jgi:hypothetical protein
MNQKDGPGNPAAATSYIRRIHQAVDADSALVKMFFDELRRFAQSEIGDHLQSRVGASDIANAALRSALSEVKKKGDEEWSGERFRRLAKRIALHKIKDQADNRKSQKRDIARETDVHEGRVDAVTGKSTDPSDQVAATELAVLFASEVFSQVATGEMATQKRLIAALTLGGYRPKEIHEILKLSLPSNGTDVVPSLRLVQLVVAEAQRHFDAIVDRQADQDNDL